MADLVSLSYTYSLTLKPARYDGRRRKEAEEYFLVILVAVK